MSDVSTWQKISYIEEKLLSFCYIWTSFTLNGNEKFFAVDFNVYLCDDFWNTEVKIILS